MLVELELPTVIYAKDYHEFGDYENFLRKLNPQLKVREIHGAMESRDYVGVVFLKDEDYENICDKWWMGSND